MDYEDRIWQDIANGEDLDSLGVDVEPDDYYGYHAGLSSYQDDEDTEDEPCVIPELPLTETSAPQQKTTTGLELPF